MHHPKQPQHHSLSRRDLLKLAAGTLLGALHPAARAAASAYPSQPIRLIVPYPAGGSSDIIARAISQPLSTHSASRPRVSLSRFRSTKVWTNWPKA